MLLFAGCDLFTTPQYTVTFNLNGGAWAETSNTVKVKKNEKVTEPVTKPTNGTKEFVGWSTKQTPYTEYNFDTLVTKNTTLWAFWSTPEPTMTIPEGTYELVSAVIKGEAVIGGEEVDIDINEWLNNQGLDGLFLVIDENILKYGGYKFCECGGIVGSEHTEDAIEAGYPCVDGKIIIEVETWTFTIDEEGVLTLSSPFTTNPEFLHISYSDEKITLNFTNALLIFEKK